MVKRLQSKSNSSSTRAHQRYYNEDGKLLPGVTTILGLLNKPALIPWAWNLGMAGQDFRKVVDKAANIGTATHYLVECYLKDEKPQLDDFTLTTVQRARLAFSKFEQWWDNEGLEVVGSEVRLVSEVMQCGGTIDCMARKGSELWLVDVKTSKGIYDEMLYQLAAYWVMWNENNPDDHITNAHIVQLNKETGQLAHYSYDKLFTELEIFRHLRVVYSLRRDTDPKRTLDRLMPKLTLDRL